MVSLHKEEGADKKQMLLRVLLITSIAIPVLIFISTLFNRTETEKSFSPASDIIGVIQPLQDGQKIQQVFTTTTDTITEVRVQIGTYERTNHFILEMKITEFESGKVLFSQDIDASNLVDNAYEIITFEPVSVKRGRLYTITFCAKGATDKNTITFYRTADLKEGRTDYVCVDGVQEPYSLALYVLGHNVTLNVFTVIVLGLILAIIIGGVYILYVHRISVEVLFAILAFLLGGIYLFVITPFSVPDEGHHYQSAYQLSNFLLLRFDENNYGNSNDFNYSGFVGHYNVASGYMRIIEEIGKPNDEVEGELIEIPQPRSLNYPVQYIPQALGIAISRATNQNLVRTLILGRLFNLCFYVGCLFLSIRRIPRFKVMLGIIGIMPMQLHQMASLSYDVFVNSMAFLLIASLLKAIYEEGFLSKVDFGYILVTGMLLAPTKVVYYLILFLMLLIPRRRFGDRKKKFVCIATVLLASAIFLVLFKAIWVKDLAFANETTHYTAGFVLRHPFQTMVIFARTAWYSIGGWITAAIGSSLSGATLSIPIWIAFGVILIVFLAALDNVNEKSDLKVCGVERGVFLVISIPIVLLIMLSQFFAYTPKDLPLVYGVQGRYFIPIIPLLALSMNNQTIVLKKNIDNQLIVAAILLNAATIISVLDYTI